MKTASPELLQPTIDALERINQVRYALDQAHIPVLEGVEGVKPTVVTIAEDALTQGIHPLEHPYLERQMLLSLNEILISPDKIFGADLPGGRQYNAGLFEGLRFTKWNTEDEADYLRPSEAYQGHLKDYAYHIGRVTTSRGLVRTGLILESSGSHRHVPPASFIAARLLKGDIEDFEDRRAYDVIEGVRLPDFSKPPVEPRYLAFDKELNIYAAVEAAAWGLTDSTRDEADRQAQMVQFRQKMAELLWKEIDTDLAKLPALA